MLAKSRKILYFPTSHNSASIYTTWQNRKTRKCIFSLKRHITALPEFNQSMLAFLILLGAAYTHNYCKSIVVCEFQLYRLLAATAHEKGSLEFRAATVELQLRAPCSGACTVLLKDKIIICDMFDGS